MADRIPFALYSATTGTPLTGVPIGPADMRFLKYVDKLGNARTPPAITELGGGQYGFSPTDADEAAGVVFLLDSVIAEPRRHSGAIHTPLAPFVAWHLEDDAGALWAGASPTIALWDDFAGNARTPPSVTAPGATSYLFAVTPSTADLAIDVAFRIDSPAGAEPPYVTGSLEAQPWVAPSPGPLKDPAGDVAAFLNGKTAGATLLTLGTNLFIGEMRSGDRTPAPAVFCLGTGGPSPEPYLGGHRTALYRPMVQVLVRGPAGDNQAGELLAREVLAWLNLQVVAGYLSWFARDSAPAYLGADRDQHGQWSMNIECQYRASLA